MKIGFITDIHEDIKSLEAAFTTLDTAGCDTIVCLGDIVGFTLPFQKNIDERDASACIEMVRARCSTVVAGNHDLYAVRRIPKLTADFPAREDWYELPFEKREKFSKGKFWLYEDSELPPRLTEDAASFLRSLPEYAIVDAAGERFLLSHFHFPDPSGSSIAHPRKSRHLARHFHFMEDNGCTRAFSGHGHPEGMVIATPRTFGFREFGLYCAGACAHWFVCPCVANTSRKNGVMVYDSHTRAAVSIPLGSRKKLV